MTATIEPALMQGIIFTDGVIREHGTGKCSFIGSFQVYNLPAFPFAVYPFFVTAFVTNLGGDLKGIDVTVRVENPQNSMVLASASAKITFQQPPQRMQMFEVSIPIVGLTFQSAGNYAVVVLVNNEKVGERPLTVNDIRSKGIPQ